MDAARGARSAASDTTRKGYLAHPVIRDGLQHATHEIDEFSAWLLGGFIDVHVRHKIAVRAT